MTTNPPPPPSTPAPVARVFDTSAATVSLAQVAAQLGVSETLIRKIERRALTEFLAEIEARGAALGVSGHDYLTNDEIPITVPKEPNP